jgi:hypothetical protein
LIYLFAGLIIQVATENPIGKLVIEKSKKESVTNLWTQLQANGCLGTMRSQKAIIPLVKSLINLINDSDPLLKNTYANEATYYEMHYFTYIGTLVRIGGEKVLAEVLPYLKDENINIRYACADILGSLNDIQSVPCLIEMLTLSDNQGFREKAANLLGNLSDNRAIPALKDALQDKYIDWQNPLRRPVADAAYSALLKLDVKVEVKYLKEGEPPVYRVVE